MYEQLPLVSVAATDVTGSENAQDPVAFTFSRSGPVSEPLSVSFDLSGTAMPTLADENGQPLSTDADYLIDQKVTFASGKYQVTIPAGQSSVIVTMTPLNDSINAESTENIHVAIAVPAGVFTYEPTPEQDEADGYIKPLKVDFELWNEGGNTVSQADISKAIQDLDSAESAVRETAKTNLTNWLKNDNGLASIYEQQRDGLLVEGQGRLDAIINSVTPIKIDSIFGGTVKLSLRLPAEAGVVTKVTDYIPYQNGNVKRTMGVDGPDVIEPGQSELPDLVLTPLKETDSVSIEITIERTDAAGNVTYQKQTFEIKIREYE